jgi:hypothetical protein
MQQQAAVISQNIVENNKAIGYYLILNWIYINTEIEAV